MGWSSASSLMGSIIDAFKENFPDADKDKAVAFWEKAIDAFQEHDWDTEGECLGEDENFDLAYYRLAPYQHGYKVAFNGGNVDDNPWEKEDKRNAEWARGFKDGISDLED